MNKFKVTLTLLVSLFVLNACNKDKDKLAQPVPEGPKFNINKFEQNLIDYVTFAGNQPTAWSYTISQNGQLKKWNSYGKSRTVVDGNENFTVSKKINIASISKFYTAIAVMQLLQANNLNIENKIAPWLPASWTKGPGVAELSFKDLLKHESGLSSVNTDFDNTLGYQGLKSCIQTGVINNKSRNYLNVNFALFRVLIPSLWKNLPGSPNIDIENDLNTQNNYLSYMQQNIFGRIHLQNIGCDPEAREVATLYYNNLDLLNNKNGTYYGSWNNKSGGGGYFMSTLEIAAVNAYFEHTEVLLSDNFKNIMKTHRIGMDLGQGDAIEQHGKYYGKGGSISNGANQGILGQTGIFPINGIDCVVMMNSQGNSFKDGADGSRLDLMIYKAYNDAWE
jgi:D-alanyl-D-alanine carboxypeptidase